MATTIDCDKIDLKTIFSWWFVIPDYQRAYVWGKDQVLSLLEDTYAAYSDNPESEYFIGSLVLKKSTKKENNVEFTEYELLDGQQRMTTLLIMFAVIRDIISIKQIKKKCIEAVYQEEDIYENQPERMRIVFNIREDVKAFVNDYIKNDDSTNDIDGLKTISKNKKSNISVRNMAAAILTMREFFSDISNDIPNYYKFLLNKVLMIYVSTNKLEDAFQMFTVLNNRGVKLGNADILKAENLRPISNQNDRHFYAKKWEEIEDYFGDDFDKFLSYIRTILVKRKADSTLFKEFKEIIYSSKVYNRTTKSYDDQKPLLERGKSTFDCIESYYRIYCHVFDDSHFDETNSYEINNYLTLMNVGLRTDLGVAPILYYYKKFKMNEFADFLKKLDNKLSSDWITSISPSKRIENVNDILKAIETSDSPQNLFSTAVFDYNVDDLERILSGDIYGKRFDRYIMLKIDLLQQGHNKEFTVPKTTSIEHILPQNPATDSQWCEDFTEDERIEWTDKLGNLCLLSRRKNSAQSNFDFELKMKKYFEKNIELFAHSVNIFNKYKKWGLNELQLNHNNTLEIIINAYK